MRGDDTAWSAGSSNRHFHQQAEAEIDSAVKRSARRTEPLRASLRTGIDGVAFHYFTDMDVVRHRLVRDIIRAYDQDEAKT